MNKTELILTDKGLLVERTIEEVEKEVSREALNSLSNGITRVARNAFSVGGMAVHLVIPNDGIYCSVRLAKLPLKAPFKIEDGVLYPKFSAKNEPIMPMFWTPPEDMRLVMLVMLSSGKNITVIHDQWLVAYDAEKRAYRLPLGNLYGDARLCNGEMGVEHPTLQDCVKAELEQFEKGQWNGDLDNEDNADMARKMFRFVPHNDRFEQMPPTERWQSICDKISPPILKHVEL